LAAFVIERAVRWCEVRFGNAPAVRAAMRKAFPDHWSFMLGEINLYSFAVLLVTGTFLALFFDSSDPYRSVLRISFGVDAGLFVRQVHHWASLVFVAAICVHMARVFFTGAFRRPRELTWMLGTVLLMLAILEGFAGYSLPGDLLSGLGLRIANSVALSVPLIGLWLSSVLFTGPLGGVQMPRLFALHVYLLPALIAAVTGAHLGLVWIQKHTQFRGPGRTETAVTGSPLYPNYALRSLALFAGVLAVLCVLGAFVQINPVWVYGPYVPWLAMSPAQPDWYTGWLEGALRLGPAWSLHVFGRTIPAPFWPGVLLPGVLFTVVMFWPFIEARVTGDRRDHQFLDRPRDAAVRTGIGCALAVFVIVLTLAGSDDVQARYTYLSVLTLTIVYRVLLFVAPVAAGFAGYAIARHLSRDGIQPARRVRLIRTASGGFEEETVP
jgi:ubiquinol-cytochrome c reductase cytochrome b subunit